MDNLEYKLEDRGMYSHSRPSIIRSMFCIQILVLEWNSELSEEALHGMIRIIIHIVI